MDASDRLGIPGSFLAVLSDRVLVAMIDAFVHQVQMVVDLDGRIDLDRLGRAHRLLLDAEPILGCRLERRWARPTWRRLPARELDRAALPDVVEVGTAGDADEATQAALGQWMDVLEGPASRIALVRGPGGDRLVLKLDHHAVDAGGTKDVGYRLAELYRALATNVGLRPAPRLGSRGLDQIGAQLGPLSLPGIVRQSARDGWRSAWPRRSLRFPTRFGPVEPGEMPRFHLLHLPHERVRRMVAVGRSRGATLNDVAMTALLRALAKAVGWNGDDTLRLVSTVDLRRYAPGGRAAAACNLSGFWFLCLGRELGDDFGDTLAAMRRETASHKTRHLGLGFGALAFSVCSWMPSSLLRAAMAGHFKRASLSGNMPMLFTNMGSIDGGQLDLGGPSIRSAFLVCPASRPGFMGAGLSGHRGGLTWSLGSFASAVPPAEAARLLDLVDRELP
jgi:NRPS condensation-like uncharacterized protein